MPSATTSQPPKATGKHKAPTRDHAEPTRFKLGKLESRSGEVMAALLSGKLAREVAEQFGASLDGVYEFVERHKVEMQELRIQASMRAKDLWILDRAKTTEVLQRQVRKLDKDFDLAEPGRDSAAIAKEITSTIGMAYRINDMLPRSGVTIDARKQSITFIDGVRLPPEEAARLLAEAGDIIDGG